MLTVIFFERVALGHRRGDVGDVAHLSGQLLAMKLTLSVKSFQAPATPAWPPSRPSVSTSCYSRDLGKRRS